MTKATTTSGHASTADGTQGSADPGEAVTDRDPDPRGPFSFIVTTIEDFAAFVALARDHAHGQQAFPGFVAARTRDDSPGDTAFLLSAHSLEAFTALVGIVRGQVVDAAALAEVLAGLDRARANLKAAADREGGTPASPASGPA